MYSCIKIKRQYLFSGGIGRKAKKKWKEKKWREGDIYQFLIYLCVEVSQI